MILDLVFEPNKILKQQTEKVKKEELQKDEFQELIENMKETMHEVDGVGLAAPQIGKQKRFTVVAKYAFEDADLELPFDDDGDLPLINPTFEKIGDETETEKEACLSVPNTFVKVKRWKKIKVEAMDRHGNELSFKASGYPARVIQHEIDHLEGTLILDKGEEIEKIDPIEEAVKRRDI